jgi:DNA-binding LacI/PurR family transcriptional regulator
MGSIETIVSKKGQTKYCALVAELKNEMRQGVYKSGKKLPSEHALSERFKISRVTVRQALNVLQEEGYINRKQGLGTFVNGLIKGKPAVKIHHLAMILADSKMLPTEDDYFRLELIAAERWLAEQDITIFLATLESESIARGVIPPILKQGLVQGVLLDGRVQDVHRHILEKQGLPYLIIGNHPVKRELPQIRVDFEQITVNAVNYLYGLNQQPVMLLAEPFSLHFTRGIYNGYCTAVEKLPQQQPLIELCQGDDGYAGMKRLLKQGHKNFSVVTTDQIHNGILRAYREEGISTEDNPIVVIGSLSKIHPTQLSLIHMIPIRAEKITLSALQILMEMIEGKRKEVYEEICFEIEPPSETNVSNMDGTDMGEGTEKGMT